ncbi:segregation/condensation protein A [Patescibacteria group bacterium]|nr:segregation/condensation protein A [Patescibacteria group bacterium]MDE1946514.1 segregation/condensation protein A [Patescibacteria group bacterium]MDE2010925.1 segregation/condensation protein A [Patescibacteria group bacterium]MDE2233324.1 segregation/condensation protein A [Patescibacteria group bacterium]
MPFTVKTISFEGPLDLLLELIEKRKLFINDISLAKVTDDFIAHIKQYENLPMGESAHFILVASTLLLIKSKSLLPELNLTQEEQSDIHDLETRLKIFKRIKEAGKHIERMFGAEIIFQQSQSRSMEPVFVPNQEFTLEKALHTLKDLLDRLPKKETLPQTVVKKVISLEEMVDTLSERINKRLRMSFKDFAGEHKGDRVNIIVSFLAMLELVKNGILRVTQEKAFDDIQMETKEVSVPTY